MRKLLALLACLFLVGALTACGTSAGSDAGGGDDDPTTTAKPEGEASLPTDTSEPDPADDEDDDETTTTEDGGDEPSTGSDLDQYVEALVTGMTSGIEGDDLVLSTSEAECVAPVWVEALSEELQDVDPEDLTDPNFDFSDDVEIDEDQAETMIGAYGDCGVDIEALFVDYIASEATPEQAACIEDAVGDVDLTALLAAVLVDEDAAEAEFGDELNSTLGACATE